MGVSTDAVLFYGFCWSEEADVFADAANAADVGEGEWATALAVRRGHKDPWDGYPEAEIETLPYAERRKQGDAWADAHRAELDAWYAVKRAVEEEAGVEVRGHCSGECPMPYLCVVESRVVAARGYPKMIDPKELAAGPDWDELLARFCAEFGIAPPQDLPGWWLVSYWG